MSDEVAFYKAIGWMAVTTTLHIRSNNMGVIADSTKTSEAEWRRVTQCIDEKADSVRQQFSNFCAGDSYDQCMISGGVQRLQQLAMQKGCGNCQEKTAIVLMFLIEVGVYRLDFMELMTNHGLDHAFAVIGRARNSQDSDPKTWGPNAVIVDAWHDYGKVYEAKDIETTMYRGWPPYIYQGALRPRSIFRLI